jgi:hypothetical protein
MSQDQGTEPRPGSGPYAYLITFTCYGQRLHGDERGSVDRFHNLPGRRYVPASPNRAAYEQSLMKGEPYELDRRHRERLCLNRCETPARVGVGGWSRLTCGRPTCTRS